MLTDDSDRLTVMVGRVMRIESITLGGAKDRFLARYQGVLYGDSAEAYDALATSLKSIDKTPMFIIEDRRQTIKVLEGTINPRPSNPWVNLLMFGLTLLSMLFAGAMSSYTGPVEAGMAGLIKTILLNLDLGLPFAISLLAILLAHEFGHYLAARYHKTHVTLPYFLPFPLSPFGTMGAFIQLKEPPRNKRILLDIGVAGPLAGLVVSIPVLLYGLSLSTISQINPAPGQIFQLEGNSLLYLLSKFVVFGKLLPAPVDFGGLSPLIYWVRYFFTGQPLPLGGLDVIIHPVAWAGWAGLLVTALNLIPAGQLDGGHLVYVLFGKRARLFVPIILVVVGLLGFVWSGWWLWALIILLMGNRFAEPLDQITTLDPTRRLVAILGIIIFLLVFTPVPLIQFIAGG